jgi:gas vesicle protein
MNTTGKVALGLLVGAATGAILGILFAPDKGSETRRKIAQKSKDVANDVKHKFDDIIEKTKEKFDHQKEGQDPLNKEKVKSEMA